MTNIRRYFKDGDIVFLTHITLNRQPILIDNFNLLWSSINSQQNQHNFDLIAWAILPDHFHILLEYKSDDISNLMRRIKLSFSSKYRKKYNIAKGRIWQFRFYDHIIRDQEDLNRHIDYIHYNPLKHKLVDEPIKWQYSSFNKYYEDGFYSNDWGVNKPLNFDGKFGE